MKSLTTQHTVVIVAFLAAIVALALTGRDTAALIAVGTAVLAGIGISLGQQQAVRENTNGNMTKLLEMVQEQGKMLAAMRPAEHDKDPDGIRSK